MKVVYIQKFLSDEGPMLETLNHTIRIGSTLTFLYFDLYLYSAYAAHYVYIQKWQLKIIIIIMHNNNNNYHNNNNYYDYHAHQRIFKMKVVYIQKWQLI